MPAVALGANHQRSSLSHPLPRRRGQRLQRLRGGFSQQRFLGWSFFLPMTAEE